MNRKDVITLLTPFVPSFQREFADEDIFGKEGWLFRAKTQLPEGNVIPAKYLEGIKIIRGGLEYQLMSKDDFKREFEGMKIPEGRSVSIDYHNYAGNPHLYGEIEISGVEMVHLDKESDGIRTTSPSSDEIKANPELKYARYNWAVEPCRIVPKDEAEAYPQMWDTYDAGCRTTRFLDVKELIATAIIVCLKVIEGPFFLTFGNRYFYREDDCLLTVSADDEVELKPKTMKRFMK